MGSCNSPELEPGPLEELKASDFVSAPEPPFAAPLAREFADRTSGFLAVLDGAFVALEAEQALDLFGDVADIGAGFTAVTAAAVNPEALANLQAAEDGFRVARDKTASLQSGLPSDVQQPTTFIPFNFVVQDAAGARVAGALVTMDADFGNGSTRSTDGRGIANFGVPPTATVAYTVTHAGYTTASGIVAFGLAGALFVTLQAA